ncbi:MAG: hypothetical protein PUB10_09565 [Clostridiales bacterium]|nr:hypothetical protein [Clostridiales bacterium]
MDAKYIPPFVTLLAAAISSICSIVKRTDVTKALIQLLIVIIIFYIIGRFAQKIIYMVQEMAVKDVKKETDDDSSDTENEGASSDEDGEKEASLEKEASGTDEEKKSDV